MDAGKINKMWAVCLMAIGLTMLVSPGAACLGVELPDAVLRAAGAADLVLLPVLAFLTVKKMQNGRK